MSFNPEYFFPTIITNIPSLNGGVFGMVKPTDIYVAVDITDFSQSPTGTTKPYQILQLANFIFLNFGFIVYQQVVAATTANLNATYNNGIAGVGATLTNAGVQSAFMIDGQAGILNARYIVQFQTAPAQNGVYTLTNVGTLTTNWVLTRSIDFNTAINIVNGGLFFVTTGAVYGGKILQDTFTPPLTVGTTAINWNVFAFNPNTIVIFYAGNPNGNVPGQLGQFVWDSVNNILWVNTTAGTAATAVWSPVIGALTNGQLRIGSTGNAPVAATLTAGTNISIVNGPGAITISATGAAGLIWNDIVGNSKAMIGENGYVTENAGLTTLTLPAASNFGDQISIIGRGAGGWTIAQGAGQQVIIGNTSSTSGAGGSVSSTNRRDSLTLICTLANTQWTNLGAPQSLGLTIV